MTHIFTVTMNKTKLQTNKRNDDRKNNENHIKISRLL